MERAESAEYLTTNRIPLILLYGCTIFLSAFLLFQVQPVIGKMLLPWFGGSAAVWSTCLLFFQVLLLLGYLYAHWTSKFFSVRNQGIFHILLLASSILTLPVSLNDAWKPSGNEEPTLLIIGLMALSIGLPYFILSSTGPLLQSWFSREKTGDVPYRLFALSNFGSMIGLLSYPIIFEPNFAVPDISMGWSVTYIIFCILCAALAWRGTKAQDRAPNETLEAPKIHIKKNAYATWIILSACPTVLLMAITSHLTQNVAPVPFLWVVPLALYLMTFILCFEGGNWYRRALYLPLFILVFSAMCYDLAEKLLTQGVWIPVTLYCCGLFIFCMVCHGELARRKPHPQYLTAFYLMISLGGALGGVFVAILAPRIFNSNYELPLGLLTTALVIMTLLKITSATGKIGGLFHKAMLNLSAVWVGLIVIYMAIDITKESSIRQILVRNFYGTLSIADAGSGAWKERHLVHGAILHGSQYMQGERRKWPTTYYGTNGGAGLAILATRQDSGSQRVGVVGLGTGTIAAYGRANDYYRFYEINPLVIEMAQSQFSFIADSPADIETVLGDARLSLEREASQQFDVLVMDAFSGDSIPVHLLTREAFAVYFRHMKPGGILAVHISNKNLDLVPVVKHASDFYRKEARLIDADEDREKGWNGSTWILISDTDKAFVKGEIADAAMEVEPESRITPWTDSYSSIYAIMK